MFEFKNISCSGYYWNWANFGIDPINGKQANPSVACDLGANFFRHVKDLGNSGIEIFTGPANDEYSSIRLSSLGQIPIML
jgi:hypothetical protein